MFPSSTWKCSDDLAGDGFGLSDSNIYVRNYMIEEKKDLSFLPAFE